MRYVRLALLFGLVFVFKLIFLPFNLIARFRRKTTSGGTQKLYRLKGEDKQYWETWPEAGGHRVHWGQLGDRGESKLIPHDQTGQLEHEIAARRSEGYAEIAYDDLYGLEVIYAVEGFGTPADLSKRHALENHLNETLGWTGLGHMDGGSIGSDSMEVFVYVVDPDIAKRVIEDDLKGTKFGDFREIVIHAPFSERTADEQ